MSEVLKFTQKKSEIKPKRVSVLARELYTIDLRKVGRKEALTADNFWLVQARLVTDSHIRQKEDGYIRPETANAFAKIDMLVKMLDVFAGCHKDYVDVLTEIAEDMQSLAPYCKTPFEVYIIYPDVALDDGEVVQFNSDEPVKSE